MRAKASSKQYLIVENTADSQRLDKWLATSELVSSRSRAAELIDLGLVTSNGKSLKASYKVRSGEQICVEIPEKQSLDLQPLAQPLDVLYQDEDLIVVNKPSGLVVHPAFGHAQDTLVNILLHHVSDLSVGFSQNRPGIVHRLDRDTSGILVVAKNDRAHHSLAAQFKQKTTHRIYWALTSGQLRTKQGTFRSYLGRHATDRKRFASQAEGKGKLAITHFKVLDSGSLRPADSKASVPVHWLQCRLETGRTHQIRVHLSENGLPILGDPIYGGKFRRAIRRLALHACELGFEHPRTLERMTFRVGWPDDLKAAVKLCGFKDV